MIIKLEKVINCSSEHPSFPASNLLEYNSRKCWKCARPGEMLATVIFQMSEPSCITGLDIGNYRSCVVIVEASTKAEPDNWMPIVNHQFMSHDEAANSKFRDQVQIFTKKELNPDNLKIKFDRTKVTCMQSANPRELFGLTFITFKTEVVVDLGLDVFGRFKLKQSDENKAESPKVGIKQSSFKESLLSKVKESSYETFQKRQQENREPTKRPLLQKLEKGKTEEVFGKKERKENGVNHSDKNNISTTFTPFGDAVPAKPKQKKNIDKKNVPGTSNSTNEKVSRKHSLDSEESEASKRARCSECNVCTKDKICDRCGELLPEKTNETEKKDAETPKKPKKPFDKLFDGITFSLSGYVNPQRDSIRRKALQMGAKYIADPNTTNNKCTHLICAFKNTPKYQQLKNCSKIVSHTFIEDCFEKKIRFPWRRYALDKQDKNQPESEEEVEASTSNPYEMDTDDSDY